MFKKIVRINRKIAEIGIACDSELGKALRIRDKTRDAVMKAINEQMKDTKAAVTLTLKEVSSHASFTTDVKLLVLLHAAEIFKANDLSRCLDVCMQLRMIVQKVPTTLQ